MFFPKRVAEKNAATYIYQMNLEEAIKSSRFVNEQQKVTLNILYTAYWLRSNFSAALKPLDLTLEQHNVLRILNGMYPESMCVREIGSRMIEKSSNVPRIIDKLVEKKLANRSVSKADKRETLVSLTERGIDIIAKAKILIDQVTADVAQLDDVQSKELNALLDQLRG